MPFPTTSAEVEVLVRSLLVTKCDGVSGVANVLDKPIYIPNRDQAVIEVGFTTAEGIEVRYLSIRFLGWEDTDHGCDDAPVYKLRYSLRVFQEFVRARTAGGSSEADFTAQCLNLRDAFLLGKTLGWPQLYCEKLVVSEDAQFDIDPLTGAFGHFVEFLEEVEVTPVG